MQENYEYVQKGFRIFHPILAGFVGMEMNNVYKSKWWDELLYRLDDHADELPSGVSSAIAAKISSLKRSS